MMTQGNCDHLKIAGKATGTFYFKQFKVEDGRSTMKVGTDAVLLGAAVDVTGVRNILEIGTGSGVIALIMAQRSEANIDALEIDESSVMQAMENVIQSPWKDRISIIHNSLQNFTDQTEKKYDLIVSNPPYFSRSLKSPKEKRNISRHDESLNFDELISCSSNLISPDGSLWVILPIKESAEFADIAKRNNFHLHYRLNILPKENQIIQRYILHLKKIDNQDIKEENLVIRNTDNEYSEEYRRMTGEFYLDF
jgi:tRNA1Val (adenine37-N6)-methyltransferase